MSARDDYAELAGLRPHFGGGGVIVQRALAERDAALNEIDSLRDRLDVAKAMFDLLPTEMVGRLAINAMRAGALDSNTQGE